MNIIGISGKIGSGKSTLMRYIHDNLVYWLHQDKDFENTQPEKNILQLNFADKLKRITYELTGHYGYTQDDKNVYLPDYDMTVGKFLQIVGTDVLRVHFDNDVWVKATFSQIKDDHLAIIGDVRFPNEVDAIHKRGGIVIRLNGDPAGIRANSNRDHTHPSETLLDTCETFDYVYDNVGTELDLKMFAMQVAMDFYARWKQRNTPRSNSEPFTFEEAVGIVFTPDELKTGLYDHVRA